MMLKDQALYEISRTCNVAQFVSFSPGLEPNLRHVALKLGHAIPARSSIDDSIVRLFAASHAGSVNVRSFRENRLSGNPFYFGIDDSATAGKLVRELASEGFYTIVNETLDVMDGGVSGVSEGEIIEFAPGDTPRAVEGTDSVRLPSKIAIPVLSTVYGFDINLAAFSGQRVEFSVHPLRLGTRDSHVILWEVSPSNASALEGSVVWPNRFSRHIGDKVFGLLIAHALRFLVPRTRVFSRAVAPFEFGVPTSTAETWLRTAPIERTPGKFTTVRGWSDPFKLLQMEDPRHELIASVLAQDGVDARFSGAVVPAGGSAEAMVEGVAGFGDDFMLGVRQPEDLPRDVVDELHRTFEELAGILGPVSFEWAHDGTSVWILQLHRSKEVIENGVVVAGEPAAGWFIFEAGSTLDDLKWLIEEARAQEKGVLLQGRVGLTSHVGDVLRRSGVPARISA
jgi:hypothetical protein